MARIARLSLFALVVFSAAATSARIDLARTARAQNLFEDQDADPAVRSELYDMLEREVSALEQYGKVLKLVSRLTAPTVVHIDTEKNDDVTSRFGGRRFIEEAGSGVIVKLQDRYFVLTNWHVIKDADLEHIKVKLADGRLLYPNRVWHDPYSDVAVMAINGEALVPARIGDSDQLSIGDFVLAVGSPFGLNHSVTFGIVSAKGRRDLKLDSDDVRFQDFIQTDAAINPGNSGGPLINLRGEVVGINTAIASSSGGNEGIGFSIPINMAMRIARQLIENGNVARAFLGVQLDRNFGPAAAAGLGLPRPRGALINGITPNSPAEAAELRVGDVILSFNGIPIDDDGHLINVVGLTEVNKEVPVTIYRDRQEMTIRVIVGDRSQFEQRSRLELPPPADEADLGLGMSDLEAWDVDVLGITVVSLSPDVARRLQISQNKRGLVVTWVNPQGPVAGRLQRGEVIERIDRQLLRGIDDLERVLLAAEPDQMLQLHVAPLHPSTEASRIVLVKPNL